MITYNSNHLITKLNNNNNETLYNQYQLVTKKEGYRYTGIIVSVFNNLNDEPRYVVQNIIDDCYGMLHIFNHKQLELIKLNPIKCYVLTDDKNYLFVNIEDINTNKLEQDEYKENKELKEKKYIIHAYNKYHLIIKLKELFKHLNKDLLKINYDIIINHTFNKYDRYEDNIYYKFDYIINQLNFNKEIL